MIPKPKKCTYVYESILSTTCTCYMFRPIIWPSARRCITKDTSKYYRSSLTQCTDTCKYLRTNMNF